MNRRDAVVALVTLWALPLASEAQQADRVRRIGFLEPGSPDTTTNRKVLVESLQALGWSEGRNLVIEQRYAGNRMEDMPRLAMELVRLKPDVIVSVGPISSLALKRTGTTIPIVLVVVADPVGLGLASSLAHPGGNFTGLSTVVIEGFLGKQLQLLRDVVPKASRIAVLINPGNPMHVLPLNGEVRAKLAKDLALEFLVLEAKTRADLGKAFSEARRQMAEAMMVAGDSLFLTHRQFIADQALTQRLPTIFWFRQHVEAGGLMSYGPHASDLLRRAAGYVDRILKGAKASALPIERPTKFDLEVNLKTAKALGITVPQSLLVLADRVIE